MDFSGSTGARLFGRAAGPRAPRGAWPRLAHVRLAEALLLRRGGRRREESERARSIGQGTHIGAVFNDMHPY